MSGSDMANVKAGKSSGSDLKVPPLKIVICQSQTNGSTISSYQEDEDPDQRSDTSRNTTSDHKESSRRASSSEINNELGADRQTARKNSRTNCELKELTPQKPNKQANYFSSTSGSDRSTTTSPSSESESLDSNVTIISDHHKETNKTSKPDVKSDETTSARQQERASRHNIKTSSSNEKLVASHPTTAPDGKKTHEGPELNKDDTTSNREQSLNANQRITRSSQRAAQQNKSENSNDTNGDELNLVDQQDKVESARKAKRRKGDVHETEQDSSQQQIQQASIMANICPADYQLPAQNSFELYRDIRKRPHKKMMLLSHIQPKVPYGFKDYLMASGPYHLDGNKLGSGITGANADGSRPQTYGVGDTLMGDRNRMSMRMKLSNLHQKVNQASQQCKHDYRMPTLSEAPQSIRPSSVLYELFHDQEKARYQMRIQHLKERERLILSAEQEMLRAYNRLALADRGQKQNLSACTYLYYQERYHYLDDRSESGEAANPKDMVDSQGDSKSRNESSTNTLSQGESRQSTSGTISKECQQRLDGAQTANENKVESASHLDCASDSKVTDKEQSSAVRSNYEIKNAIQDNNSKQSYADISCDTDPKVELDSKAALEGQQAKKIVQTDADADEKAGAGARLSQSSDKTTIDSGDNKNDTTLAISDEDLKVLNKAEFLKHLQEVDDKWAAVKHDMFVRHKNESDSLYAVQCLEWEWKAKETGLCDVRATPKIEIKFVPRVEISLLDY